MLVISYMFFYQIIPNTSYATEQKIDSSINNIDEKKYPGIKNKLQELKKSYPNWNFKILYTGLDWNTVIQNEYVGHTTSSRNYISSNYSEEWVCAICGTEKKYDNGSWRCASEQAIKYCMDARNFLSVDQIFQFLELTYTESNEKEISNMVKGTFLDNSKYIQAILQAGKENNVNPYYITARILQEQGKNGSTLSKGRGYEGQYQGLYNVFNIGASGNGTPTIILNGLKRAEKEEWTSLEKSIIGGTKIISTSYIARGQNTLYLQKFDVDNTDGTLYWHQYQQNILAAQNEGKKMKSTVQEIEALTNSYTFIIPVFDNMPTTASTKPGENKNQDDNITDLVRVNVDNTLYLRESPNGSRMDKYLKSGEIVTRLEKATSKVNGTYWDHVMKSDGTKGYAARETYESEEKYKLYLVPVNETKDNNDDNIDIDIDASNIKVDKNSKMVFVTPEVKAKDIKAHLTDANIIDLSGNEVNDDKSLGTGYMINKKYTIIKQGDCNGDGEITASDYVLIKNDIMGSTLLNETLSKGADYNQDGEITASDYVLVKNYIMNT